MKGRPGFVVIASHWNEQLEALLAFLTPHPTVVHIDKYSRSITSSVFHRENLLIISSIECHWGDRSLVEAMVVAGEALMDSFMQVKSITFLSGTCVPTSPIREFVAELEKRDGNWLRVTPLDTGEDATPWSLSSERLRRNYFLLGSKLFRRLFDRVPQGTRILRKLSRSLWIPKKPFTGTQMFAGSQWFSTNSETLTESLSTYRASRSFDKSRGLFAPDEIVLQTIIATLNPSAVEIVDSKGSKLVSVANLSNFHFLRENMAGFLNDDELERAHSTGNYWARKAHIDMLLKNPFIQYTEANDQ